MQVKVLLADRDRIALGGVKGALSSEPDFEIVAETCRGAQVLPFIHRFQPDLVVLGLNLPEIDGRACLELIRKRHPDVNVVVLLDEADPSQLADALARGARAVILKSIEPANLAEALRQAVAGTVYEPIGLPPGAESGATAAGLTDREEMVARAVAKGLSNRAISSELWITEQTVKFHLTNLYRKLGVSNRTQAVHAAYSLGIAR